MEPQSEEIYAVFDEMEQVVIDEENDFTPDESAKWGVYSYKPVAQNEWEQMVKTTVAELAATETTHMSNDVRPYIRDKVSRQWLLVDSGAAVTCWPKKFLPDVPLDPKTKLQAVNGAKVNTYGYHTLTFEFGAKKQP